MSASMMRTSLSLELLRRHIAAGGHYVFIDMEGGGLPTAIPTIIIDTYCKERKGMATPESPEKTGVYKCEKCGNDSNFTGIDSRGYGGPDVCECGKSPCECDTELTQDFTVVVQGVPGDHTGIHYEAFEGGGHDSEIGSYTKIVCRDCGHIIWQESATEAAKA